MGGHCQFDLAESGRGSFEILHNLLQSCKVLNGGCDSLGCKLRNNRNNMEIHLDNQIQTISNILFAMEYGANSAVRAADAILISHVMWYSPTKARCTWKVSSLPVHVYSILVFEVHSDVSRRHQNRNHSFMCQCFCVCVYRDGVSTCVNASTRNNQLDK